MEKTEAIVIVTERLMVGVGLWASAFIRLVHSCFLWDKVRPGAGFDRVWVYQGWV